MIESPDPRPARTGEPRPAHRGPPAPWRFALLVVLGAASLLLGVRRFVVRPDLPLDFAILFVLGGVCLWQASRRLSTWGEWAIAWREASAARREAAAAEAASAAATVPAPAESRAARASPGERFPAPAPRPAPAALESMRRWLSGTPDNDDAPSFRDPRQATRVSVLLLVGVILALSGQMRLDTTHALSVEVAAAFVLAAGLWLWALARSPEDIDDAATPALPGPPIDSTRLAALAGGMGLVLFTALIAPLWEASQTATFSLLTYPMGATNPTNSLTMLGGGLWVAGGILVLWALADWEGLRARWGAVWSGAAIALPIGWVGLAVAAITAIGAWYRFHDLANLPYEMTSDHTEKLVDIASILQGLRPVFLPGNAGREPMEFYWIASLVALGLPLSFMTMKIGMSVVSTATIPVIYRLGREVASRETGLVAALIVALAPWHIQVTRIALRIAFAPLWVALTLLFLYRALTYGRRNDWLLTGLCLGLGMYGYTAFRPMLLAVPLVIGLKLAHDAYHHHRGHPSAWLSRPLAGHMAGAAAVSALVAMPLMRFAYDHRNAFFSRTLTRITDAEIPLENPALTQFFINLKNGLLMFNLTSDSAWFQSPANRPALETVGGALVALGLGVMLYRAWRRDWRLGTVVAIIPVMLLSSILSLAFPRENPSLSRASAALPMVMVLAALPLPALGARWRAAWGAAGAVAYGGLLAGLFWWMAGNTTARYFAEYRDSYDNSTHNTSEGADVVRSFVTLGGEVNHASYVGWENGWDYRAIGFMLGRPDWPGLIGPGAKSDWSEAAESARALAGDPARKLFIVGGPFVQHQIDTLRSIFPEAMVTHHTPRVPGKDFWTVFVPEARPTAGPTATPATTPESATSAATESSP